MSSEQFRPGSGGLGRVPRSAMSAAVADHIRQLIFNGTLKAGQRVPQDDLAADLGVSRLPVREALIALETDGLVTSEPHRGTYVQPISRSDIEDHYDIYGMIQGLAAARALASVSEDDVAQMRAWHEQMCTANDPQQTIRLNWDFHALLTRRGGSMRIKSILRQMSHNLPRELYELQTASPEANDGHAKILDALIAGDADALDAANREHMRVEGAYVLTILEKRDVLSD
ncbi:MULTISPECIES: GntR family transcriptional regulator [unclassified Nocardioides]|uniref:GntR family transcriptional regulator n=1 Tax=unclassified Nocardioides TaxID=2615069 RepID=UPI0036D243E4